MGRRPARISACPARLAPLYPMYLLSLLLLLAPRSSAPANFDDEFHWEPQPTDTLRGDFCEPAADWHLGRLVREHDLDLHAWTAELAAASLRVAACTTRGSRRVLRAVVHAAVLVLALAGGGARRARLALLLLLVALNFCVAAGFYAGFALLPDDDARPDAPWANWFTLGYYLFPPFWWPTFAMGATAAFLFDAHRPYLSHRAHLWGVLCDVISVGLLLQIVATVVFSTCVQKHGTFCPSGYEGPSTLGIWARLGIREDDGLGVRALAAILSRLYAPLMVLWFTQ